MLSRDADSVYWMSRYIERAEHIARVLLVNSACSPTWRPSAQFATATLAKRSHDFRLTDSPPARGLPASAFVRHMTLIPITPRLARLASPAPRKRPRHSRDDFAEMWENLNMLYWSICGDDAAPRFDESQDEFTDRS